MVCAVGQRPAVIAPSTVKIWRFTNDAFEPASQDPPFATSSGVPRRPDGVIALMFSRRPAGTNSYALPALVKPGATALTRIPRDASSIAATRVSMLSPAFVTAYVARNGAGSWPAMLL